MSEPVLAGRLPWGICPERKILRESWLDRAGASAWGAVAHRLRGGDRGFREVVGRTGVHGRALAGVADSVLSERALALKGSLRGRPVGLEEAAQVFALAREASARLIGLRPYDVQLIGAWVLLNGKVAEMETGEGKTLCAVLPACTAALAGVPVHIVTVNDYLARRDAEWMAPVYRALGLRVGVVVHGMGFRERREAYRCDVTYCTNKEVAFDYLKDRLVLGERPGPLQLRLERLSGSDARLDRLCLRGLFFAIVDEADSVLVDEARTPLILSGAGSDAFEAEVYRTALDLAGSLEDGRDFRLNRRKRTAELTDAGRDELERCTKPLSGFWAGRLRREELVRQALAALHLFDRDREYVVRDGKVQIVDEYTGRAMEGRSWERGLHQLIETKECCEVTDRNETLARISYQRFFRRYLRLSGMTGTAREVAGEFWSVYRISTVRLPTHRPVVRRRFPPRVFRTRDEKWTAVVARIRQMQAQGRPVLVGTRSVEASEELSRRLHGEGLAHALLNARQDREEAEVIARAGERGRVTVATNMAGRGTDILIPPAVASLGGLHVIATERHDARRIDRQLFGRGGRQGDPSTYELLSSLEDDLLAPAPRLVRFAVRSGGAPLGWLGNVYAGRAQIRAERRHRRVRRELLRLDETLEESLSFSGVGE